MKAILDAPVAAHGGIEAFRREGAAEKIASRLDRGASVDLAGGGDLADRLEARPIMALCSQAMSVVSAAVRVSMRP